MPTRDLDVLTWNIAHPPRERAAAVLDLLAGRSEDLLVLTEAGAGSGSATIAAAFRQAGARVFGSGVTGRDLGVLVIDRAGVAEPAPEQDDALGHRLCDLRIGSLQLAGIYGCASDPVRYASQAQRARKREWLTAYAGWLATALTAPALVIGDLNIVDPEHTDRLPYVLPEEIAVYRWMTEDLGLVDAFRRHRPAESSWFDHSGVGCRYDHAFVTAGIEVGDCALVQEPRSAGPSDHAALRITLSW